MPARKYRHPLIAVLCLSVLAGSTATSIDHSHDQGWAPHAHGCGLARWLAGPIAPAGVGDFACRHRHVIILGIEFYDGEGPPERSSPRSPDDIGVTSGLSDDGVVRDPFHPSEPLPPLAPLAARTGTSPPPSPTGRPVRVTPTSRRALCDRARGERSGVCLV